LVCYDADTGAERAITAAHVMDGTSTMYNSGTAVADFDNRDTATDTTAYDVRSGASTGPLETISIPNISGAWRFAGLADKVRITSDGDFVSDGDTVDVELYGATSGTVSDVCNNTKRYDGKVDYQADMKEHKTDSDDFGGPWVDTNGKLLACHYGYSTYFSNEWGLISRSGVTRRCQRESLPVTRLCRRRPGRTVPVHEQNPSQVPGVRSGGRASVS
jgi:hypothetical protein